MSALADPIAPVAAVAATVSVKSPPVAAAAAAAKPKKQEKKLHPTDESEFTKLSKLYRESPTELRELLRLFQAHKGDMNSIIEHLPFSSNDDRPRYQKLVETAIDGKTIAAFPWSNLEAPTTEDPKEDLSNEPVLPDRKRRKVKDGQVVLETMAEKEKSRIAAEASALQKKYCQKKEDKYEEPSDADFAAAQKRVDDRKKGLVVPEDRAESKKRKAPADSGAPPIVAAAAAAPLSTAAAAQSS